MSAEFSAEMYARIREGCQSSARAVVPYVYDLVKPETVIDVGGGEGWWADAFATLGADCVVLDDEGFDSDLDPGTFKRVWATLATTEDITVPTPPAGRYDLAVCLEVAEHLTPEHGDALVNRLCQLAPVVLFSAAIPGQGGHGHVNEQWPAYWAARFEQSGFTAWDCLRGYFWDDEQVEPWYRQNVMLMMSGDGWAGEAREEIPSRSGLPLALVHPEIYRWRLAERDAMRKLTDEHTWTGP